MLSHSSSHRHSESGRSRTLFWRGKRAIILLLGDPSYPLVRNKYNEVIENLSDISENVKQSSHSRQALVLLSGDPRSLKHFITCLYWNLGSLSPRPTLKDICQFFPHSLKHARREINKLYGMQSLKLSRASTSFSCSISLIVWSIKTFPSSTHIFGEPMKVSYLEQQVFLLLVGQWVKANGVLCWYCSHFARHDLW